MKKFFCLLVLIGILAATGFFFYVDKNIVARLEYKKPQGLPSLFSEAFEIAAHASISPSVLKSALVDRSYREVKGEPTRSGEFSINGANAVIFTRPFNDSAGEIHTSQSVTLEAKDEKLVNTSPTSLILEPQLIAHLGSGEMRASTYKSLQDIPEHVKKAVIAIEDERFYSHHGVDLIGITRAMVQNIKAMRLVQGGSTLTQQLAKNLLFTPEKTLGRKLIEVASAISIETRYSKDEILELYLNEVYLGQEGSVSIHGVAEGAQTFFGKRLDELELPESAMLAGLIQAPSAYSPRRNLNRALKRRDLVLEKMAELGFITEVQKIAAETSRPRIIDAGYHRMRIAPFFVEATSRELSSVFNVENATLTGLRVYTGLNRQMQVCAERAVEEGMAAVEKEFPKITKGPHPAEAGFIAIEPFSGKIRAYVGGRDYSKNQFDHVSQAKRQIGSTIKPFLYLSALDGNLNSYRPATTVSILPDEPMSFEFGNQPLWEPENYDKKFRGDVTLRYALEHSLNMPSAYLITRIGISSLVTTAKRFRLADTIPAVPSLALGTAETTLFKLAASYGGLANGGTYVPPRLYLSALDGEGKLLAKTSLEEEKVADERAVYVLTNILEGVIDRGTAAKVRTLGFTREAAGKTGTSNDLRDAWFMGFTPSLVAGAWVGYDDNTPIGLTGGQGAVPIWTSFMKCVEPLQEPLTFIPPSGVVFAKINPKTGGRVSEDCPSDQTINEVFVEGTEPPVCPDRPPPPDSLGEDHSHDEVAAPEGATPTPPGKRRDKGLWDILFGG